VESWERTYVVAPEEAQASCGRHRMAERSTQWAVNVYVAAVTAFTNMYHVSEGDPAGQ